MQLKFLNLVAASFVALVLAVQQGFAAEDLASPQNTVLLTVSGNIALTNSGETAIFDLDMLEDMDVTTIETTTIWTEGTQTFTGVSLQQLADTLGVTTGTFRATAINDYTIEIPVSDAVQGGPIIAYALNGAAMSIRDKGPLWIVYPYDQSPEYRTEVIYSRSIWQLDRIEVVQ